MVQESNGIENKYEGNWLSKGIGLAGKFLGGVAKQGLKLAWDNRDKIANTAASAMMASGNPILAAVGVGIKHLANNTFDGIPDGEAKRALTKVIQRQKGDASAPVTSMTQQSIPASQQRIATDNAINDFQIMKPYRNRSKNRTKGKQNKKGAKKK